MGLTIPSFIVFFLTLFSESRSIYVLLRCKMPPFLSVPIKKKKSTHAQNFPGDSGVTGSRHVRWLYFTGLLIPSSVPSFLPSSTLRGIFSSSSFTHRLFFRLTPLTLGSGMGLFFSFLLKQAFKESLQTLMSSVPSLKRILMDMILSLFHLHSYVTIS